MLGYLVSKLLCVMVLPIWASSGQSLRVISICPSREEKADRAGILSFQYQQSNYSDSNNCTLTLYGFEEGAAISLELERKLSNGSCNGTHEIIVTGSHYCMRYSNGSNKLQQVVKISSSKSLELQVVMNHHAAVSNYTFKYSQAYRCGEDVRLDMTKLGDTIGVITSQGFSDAVVVENCSSKITGFPKNALVNFTILHKRLRDGSLEIGGTQVQAINTSDFTLKTDNNTELVVSYVSQTAEKSTNYLFMVRFQVLKCDKPQTSLNDSEYILTKEPWVPGVRVKATCPKGFRLADGGEQKCEIVQNDLKWSDPEPPNCVVEDPPTETIHIYIIVGVATLVGVVIIAMGIRCWRNRRRRAKMLVAMGQNLPPSVDQLQVATYKPSINETDEGYYEFVQNGQNRLSESDSLYYTEPTSNRAPLNTTNDTPDQELLYQNVIPSTASSCEYLPMDGVVPHIGTNS